MKYTLIASSILLLVSTLAPVVAVAQEEGSGSLVYSDTVSADEYQPATQLERPETVSAPLVVSLAYGFMWLLVAGFLLAIWRRSQAIATELSSARQQLAGLDEQMKDLLNRGTE